MTIRLKLRDKPNWPDADDPDVPATGDPDTWTLTIFQDHLQRDQENEADLNSNGANPLNCYGAAWHAYNGSVRDKPPPFAQTCQLYSATDHSSIPPDDPFDSADLAQISRGDEVVFKGPSANHIATFTSDHASGLWEYSGRINPRRWGTSTVEDHLAEVRDNGERVFTEAYLHKKQ